MASLILNHSIDVWLSDPVIRHFVTVTRGNIRFSPPLADQEAVEANESAIVVLLQTEVTRVLRETFGHYWRLGDDGSERVVWSSAPEEQAYVSGLLYTAFPDVDRFCTELDLSQMVGKQPFKRISLQPMFDKAWKRFVVEKRRPGFSGGICSYRSMREKGGHTEECRCAVGWSLPNIPAILERQVGLPSLVEAYPFLFEKDLVYLEHKSKVLHDIQYRLHDKCVSKADGEWYSDVDLSKVYREFAEEFGLKVPEADACS
jgi:hypothetical protein